MKTLVAALLLASVSVSTLAQTTPAVKGEIMDVEVTSSVSETADPFLSEDLPGEVEVPLAVTRPDGRPAPGVAVRWNVQNTGKNPAYVIAQWSEGQRTALRVRIEPGATNTFATTTGSDGRTKLLLNATAAGQVRVVPVIDGVEVKNLREVVHLVDWIQ